MSNMRGTEGDVLWQEDMTKTVILVLMTVLALSGLQVTCWQPFTAIILQYFNSDYYLIPEQIASRISK